MSTTSIGGMEEGFSLFIFDVQIINYNMKPPKNPFFPELKELYFSCGAAPSALCMAVTGEGRNFSKETLCIMKVLTHSLWH